MEKYNVALKKLQQFNQEHILRFYAELNNKAKQQLLDQIISSDFSVLKHLNAFNSPSTQSDKIEPISVMTLDKIAKVEQEYSRLGLKTIQEGKVAALLLAGGQGTRLGVDKSKGMVNIGRTKDLYIFECLFNNILDVVKKANTWMHFYIMTSDINNDEIICFLNEHKFFGYNSDYVHFFVQEMLPATDFDGKFLLNDKASLALSPNGNGGWFSSLYNNSKLYSILKESGAEWINCFSVDNVLQRIADERFIGATLNGNFDCGAKVIKKNFLEERVGHICQRNSKPSIIEYYEMTEELLNKRDENGGFAFDYGVTLNYLFKVSKLEQTLKENMPIHIVKKKVSFINDDGELIEPQSENAFKFETLILDMVEMLGTCLPFEVEREREFAPIKNKEGVDSIKTAQELLLKNNIKI